MLPIHVKPTKKQTRLIETLCDQLGVPEVFPQTKSDARSVIAYLLMKVKIQQAQDAEDRFYKRGRWVDWNGDNHWEEAGPDDGDRFSIY